jgi:hypothetical protein
MNIGRFDLEHAFATGDRRGDGPAANTIRDLVERLILHGTGTPGEVRAEITGRLRALLGATFSNSSVESKDGSGGPLQPIRTQRW